MIDAWCESITVWLIKHTVIDDSDRELYHYAVHSLIMFVAPLFLTTLIGVVIGKLLEGVIFAIPFMCIRKFSGGYHAEKEWICIVSSCGMITAFLLVLSYVRCDWKLHISVAAAVLWLIAFSPIDSEARRLDASETARYKKITEIQVFVFVAIYIGMSVVHMDRYAVYVAGGIIQTAVLQVPCVIFESKNRHSVQ